MARVPRRDPRQYFGYALSADTSQQKILAIVGPRRSGKGTTARVLTRLLGKDHIAAPTLASMATNFGLEALIGKQLAIVSDVRLGNRTDQAAITERLLSISGEDSLTIDRKYKPAWTGRLSVRFLLLTNELPRLADASGALVGRLLMLLLTRSFFGREDPGLTQKLLTNMEGILNWAHAGYLSLRERGHFVQPGSSEEAITQMEHLGSPVRAFAHEQCEVGPAFEVPRDKFYGEYKIWCDGAGIKPAGKEMVGRDLRAVVPTLRDERPRNEDGKRVRKYIGIRLKG